MIDPDLVERLEGGCSLLIGTVGDDGLPHASRGWGMEVVDPAEGRARIVVPADDDVLLQNLQPGRRLAANITDITNLEAVQAKGRVISVQPATPADQRRSSRYRDAFFGNIEQVDGTPRALLDRLVPREVNACVVVFDEWYDQTPGPSAGTPIGDSAS